MIKLKNVILQLDDDDYTALSSQLKETKADKFHTLLEHYRKNDLTDEQVSEQLGVNSSAYYTLKSRLFNKVQEFLTANIAGSKVHILRNVANIPNLIYNTQRDTAIAILNKLEKDLIEFDMPYELTNVYNALKKLHIHSPKYYEYTQLYNKHVAYTISLDKAEDLLSSFQVKLGNYYVSRDPSLLEILWLEKKEMTNLSRLYESHHLKVYTNIINISFALYLPMEEAIKDDPPVEDILDETQKIFKTYPKDTTYQYLRNVYNFLAFEYYHTHKLYKKEVQYFDDLNNNLPTFLLCNFCCFNSRFLLSKIERYLNLNKPEELWKENKELTQGFQPDKADVANYISYNKYLALSAFYAGKYGEAISILNNLLNDISFKGYTHAELEIKLLLTLCYSMVNKYELAHGLIRSASRKIREIKNDVDYDHASIFIKLLNTQMDSVTKDKESKIKKYYKQFHLLNQTDNSLLEQLVLDDELLTQLAKSVK